MDMVRYTELKSTDRQDLMEVLPLAKPFTLLIEPSSLCNFRCIQCFQSIKGPSYFTENRMHMPMERFERVIGQLRDWPGAKLKVLKLSLYGEPLLNPEFGSMLRLAREADVAERIETTTNASLLTRDVAEAIVDGQLDYVRVSIYSADAARHRSITRSPVAIDAIHENLRVLQEVKRARGSNRPFASCKMLDAYGEENERFARDVPGRRGRGVPRQAARLDQGGRGRLHRVLLRGRSGPARRDLEEHSSARVACPMAFTTMAVRSNGAVSPCCVDFIGGTNLGNVDESSLQALWSFGRVVRVPEDAAGGSQERELILRPLRHLPERPLHERRYRRLPRGETAVKPAAAKISIVSGCLNEEGNLQEFYDRIVADDERVPGVLLRDPHRRQLLDRRQPGRAATHRGSRQGVQGHHERQQLRPRQVRLQRVPAGIRATRWSS